MKNMILLSKTISRILRHEPWFYELELDDEGWVLIDDLLIALGIENSLWKNLTINDINNLIVQSEKRRHEIKNGKIRAHYGHSTPIKISKKPMKPPKVLFHGTSPEVIVVILKEGLKPMRRHYVHLSIDVETARQVGLRKSRNPLILIINAQLAHENNICFYEGNEHVWLSDCIPAEYINHIIE